VRGAYHRAIALHAPTSGTVTGELEDDFHHFRVTVDHDGSRVVSVRGEAVRFPWSTCPDATEPLCALEGMALSDRSSAVADQTDPYLNCTHMFDTAGLAIALVASGRDERRYDIEVPDRDDDWATQPTLWRDGQVLLRWDVTDRTITSPEPFAGVQLRGGFATWAWEALDVDTAEAAVVLRRAIDIAFGRLMDMDAWDRASDVGHATVGNCHSFQPAVVETALRIKGTGRTFTGRPGDRPLDSL
jgi:hypothetical protein